MDPLLTPTAMILPEGNLNVFSIFPNPENMGLHTLIRQIKEIVAEIAVILITVNANVNCQNHARSVPHVNGHKCLDDATENVKSHLRLKCEAAFAASGQYVTVQRLKGLKCAVVCYFNGRILLPRTYYTVSKNYARSFFS